MPLHSNANNYSINNITATPTAITYAAGRTGQNAVFNGSSSVIKTDFAWRPTTGWTIAGWLKPTDNDGIVIRSNTKYSPWISIQDSTSIQFGHWYTTNDYYRLTYLTTADILNKWLHYCSTWDGSTLRLYVNGELKDSMPAPREPYITGNMEIGYCDAVPSVGYYKGQMADLRLYNYALSESEIYELSLARVGHWMLNGMQMTTGDKTEYDGEQGKKGTANNALQGRKNAASPRYQNCFIANGSYIKLPAVPYSGVVDEFSYNVWAYAPAWTSAAFGSATYSGIFNCVEGGGWGLHWTKSGSILSCWFHNGSSYVGPNVVSTNLSNGWHMITATTNGTDINIYVDAVLIANSSHSKFTINQKNTPFIGYECSGASAYSNGQFKGNISEIELFAKHLTAEDVAKRYQKAHIPT